LSSIYIQSYHNRTFNASFFKPLIRTRPTIFEKNLKSFKKGANEGVITDPGPCSNQAPQALDTLLFAATFKVDNRTSPLIHIPQNACMNISIKKQKEVHLNFH
jgi:hypothetical protein